MADPEQDDALIEDLLDEALEGYDGIVPPEIMAAIRGQIGDTLAATEAGRRMLRQVRPDPVVARSADLDLTPRSAKPAPRVASMADAKRGKRR